MAVSVAADWGSAAVPPSIRRPWRVFEEDLEDKVADAASQDGEVPADVKQKSDAVQSRGAEAVFLELPEHLRRTYAEVSLMELSAFVRWRRAQVERQSSAADGKPPDYEAAWDQLDMDDKGEWVPEDPKAALAGDPTWEKLLAEVTVTQKFEAVKSERPADEPQKSIAKKQEPVGGALDQESSKHPASETKDHPRQDANATSKAEGAEAAKKRSKKGSDASFSTLTPSRAGGAARAEAGRPRRSSSVQAPPRPSECGGAAECTRSVCRKVRKPVLENLYPEALEAKCHVCGSGEATDDNDLALCDRCDKAFHQACHDPPVERFGSVEDSWFCQACTTEMAKSRGLALKEGDFAWARLPMDPILWPVRVLRVDFSSLEDPKPYWVSFFDASGKVEGAWVPDSTVVPWEQGPTFDSIKDAPRRLAVRLAEGSGAKPISGATGQVQLAPLPARTPKHAFQSVRAAKTAAGPAAAKRPAPAGAAGPPNEPLRRSKRGREAAQEDQSAFSKQVDEMRQLIEAAKSRQERLEKEIEEVATQQVAGSQVL